ncbi:hypothetical protein D3C76_1358970 [compost metagenome]|uniref:M15 family metallopeptidase n=1 Tax=unclassified Paenibacillus TaxID=185978 RepID=UPI000BA16CB8|nr:MULTISPECIES: M15 family metallopeptidase [unclassified Paenibacillus]MDH6369767.1 hypothetical protein [Paenibacillus sp. PastF-3]OZQ75358.1 hypothetical protein CA598_31035 [Paenibacillus sp. VTT E-133291]
MGFEWGGDWTSFKDYPHFQLTFGLSTADYRNGKQPTQTQIVFAYALISPKPDKSVQKEDDNVEAVKDVLTKDNSVHNGFIKDNENYVPISVLKALGHKVSWDNVNKKLYIS